jgi:hypothetical protein
VEGEERQRAGGLLSVLISAISGGYSSIFLLRVTVLYSVASQTTIFQFVTLPDAMKHLDGWQISLIHQFSCSGPSEAMIFKSQVTPYERGRLLNVTCTRI